ncbi:MAG TPA: oxidoreductase [Mycobacteriales bacterium]|nr:oxidoreductase [Mycobacteriales bacterium]
MSRWTPADIPDLSGRTALVTGANSGLGFWTSVELARKGARVLMACRNPERASDALTRLGEHVPQGNAELLALDLASLASIERAAGEVATRVEALDLLVNNAGIMAVGEGRTEDGFELQLGTNHLGHFALTGRVLPLLLKGADSRVVTVSSYAHKMGKIDFEDLMGAEGYRRWRAYGQSKLANLLFTHELDRRAHGRLTAVAAHPGYAATHLQQGQGQKHFEKLMSLGNKVFAQSDVQGAWPSLRAATDPDVRGNEYYGPHFFELRGHPVRTGRTRHASSSETATRLWDVSEKLTGVHYDL